MKKFFLLTIVSFNAMTCLAQLPPGVQPKTQLPAPKLKALSPADLQVTNISLVSCTKDNAAKRLVITVSVTIKNNGQIRAGSSALKSYFNSPAGTATSRPVDGTPALTAIDAGASVTAQYVFRRPFSSDAGFTLVPFDFWVRADANNVINESNEVNNGSSKIQITPPR